MAKKTRTKKSDNVQQASKVRLKSPPKRGTAYQPILDSMANLKPGEAYVFSPPKGVDIATYQNRLNAAMRRFPVQAPRGHRFTKRTTEDNKVAIMLVKNN